MNRHKKPGDATPPALLVVQSSVKVLFSASDESRPNSRKSLKPGGFRGFQDIQPLCSFSFECPTSFFT